MLRFVRFKGMVKRCVITSLFIRGSCFVQSSCDMKGEDTRKRNRQLIEKYNESNANRFGLCFYIFTR